MTMRASLDQAAGQQAALPVHVAAVALAHRRRLAGQVERLAGGVGGQEREGALLIGVHHLGDAAPLEGVEPAVHLAEQPLAPLEPAGNDVRPQLQLGEAEVRGVRVLRLAAVPVDLERVVGAAHPAAVDARGRRPADPFGDDPRRGHVGDDEALGRSEPREHGANAGVVVRPGAEGHRRDAGLGTAAGRGARPLGRRLGTEHRW
jgi:hypothetical protein